MRERFGGAPIAVCLELSQGPIVSALLEQDCFVLFPVQPTALARDRLAFTPSRAKDDPTDAELALELLLRHPEKLKRLQPESADMRALRRLVETRRTLVDDRVRLTNRMTHALKAYFPQVLTWFRDKDAAIFADFLERWPTLEAAQRARKETLADFFRSGNVRYKAAIERRIEAIRSESPLTTGRTAARIPTYQGFSDESAGSVSANRRKPELGGRQSISPTGKCPKQAGDQPGQHGERAAIHQLRNPFSKQTCFLTWIFGGFWKQPQQGLRCESEEDGENNEHRHDTSSEEGGNASYPHDKCPPTKEGRHTGYGYPEHDQPGQCNDHVQQKHVRACSVRLAYQVSAAWCEGKRAPRQLKTGAEVSPRKGGGDRS
jgi:hypothetical protein